MIQYDATWDEVMEYLIKRGKNGLGFSLEYHYITGGRFNTAGMEPIRSSGFSHHLDENSFKRKIITEIRIEQMQLAAEKFKV